MTVEMNSPSTLSHPHSGSFKHEKMGAQELDDIERRLSDDMYSLNSWTEHLSTSSSSDSVSHHSASSSRQHRDIKTQTIGKMLHVGQKKKVHKSSKPRSKLSSSMSMELESTTVPISCVNDYPNEVLINDPYICDIENYNTYDIVDVSLHPSKSNNVHTDEDAYKNVDITVPADTTHFKTLDASKLSPQRLYPDLEAMKLLDSQGNISETSPSASSSIVTNSNTGSQQHSIQRRSYFDFQKLPNRHSRNLEAHSDYLKPEGFPKSFSALPTSSPNSSQNSDIYRQKFGNYKVTDARVPQQNVSLVGRLHKSQPSIASAPQLKRLPKSSNDLESLRLSFEHRLEPENVKTKVKSVWNNIKYGWTFKSKPSFKCDSPLFILGKCYHKHKDDLSMDIENQFLRDFVSRIWLTYRSNFYPIPGTKLITDCGWGCMLRSGQMLIAQCLVTHFLGRDWRLYNKQTEKETVYYREILRWFSDPIDTPSDKTPFCLHHLANIGRTYNKDPGQWYGPASVAYIFRDAFKKASQTIPVLSQLCVYVAQDCTVYIDDVIKLCTEKKESESASSESENDGVPPSPGGVQDKVWQRSLIILIPIRLGGEVMNEIYIPCVQSLLSQDNCMGIIGGKPRHSLYFLGWQGDKLIYLDPHLCREAVDTSVSDFRIESYHCMTPRRLSINKMDPSCTVGFYIHDGDQFKRFVQEVKEFVSPPKQKGAYPLFIFAEGHLNDSPGKQTYSAVDKHVKVTHYHLDQNGQRHRAYSQNSEDFVML